MGLLTGTGLPSLVGHFDYGRKGEILRCPWHAWEFDLRSGRSLHNPEPERVKAYPIRLEGDDVLVQI